MAKKTITVRFKKSTIGCTQSQIDTVRGLGLRKLRQESTLPNTPAVRGMIKKVIHLVDVVKEE
ncbi:MAG: 50S ribosomal protein L30 [Oligoflexia bacterium]|nr:50S ribosomal protein L30 [Oligoflexia bacterium]